MTDLLSPIECAFRGVTALRNGGLDVLDYQVWWDDECAIIGIPMHDRETKQITHAMLIETWNREERIHDGPLWSIIVQPNEGGEHVTDMLVRLTPALHDSTVKLTHTLKLNVNLIRLT